jgi:hypothetical protein
MPSIVMEEDGGTSSRIRHPPLMGTVDDIARLLLAVSWLLPSCKLVGCRVAGAWLGLALI